MKVTQAQLRAMLPGQTLTIRCDGAPDYNSAGALAYKVKREHKREDGYVYKVRENVKALTVTVELVEPENTEEI